RGLSLLLDLIGLAALPRILRRGLALLGPGVFLLLADLRLGRRRRRTPDQGDPMLVVGERIPRAPRHGARFPGGALSMAVRRVPKSATQPSSMVRKRSVSQPFGSKPARRAGLTQRSRSESFPNRTRTDSRSGGRRHSDPAPPSLSPPSARMSAMGTGCAPSNTVHSAPSGTVTWSCPQTRRAHV